MWVVALLFVAGVILLFAEFLLPGAILGVIGAGMIVASMALGWVRYPEYGLFIFGGEAVGVLVAILLGFYMLSNTKFGNILVMEEEQQKSEGYVSPSEDPARFSMKGVESTRCRTARSSTRADRSASLKSRGTG